MKKGCSQIFHQFKNSLNLFFDININVNAQKRRPFHMPELLDYPVNAISPWLVSHIKYKDVHEIKSAVVDDEF